MEQAMNDDNMRRNLAAQGKWMFAQSQACWRTVWAMDAYEWDNGMLQMTPIEAWLWHDIRHHNVILYPQYPVGAVFVDFANPVAKVAIECDGAAYHLDKAKDQARDAKLRANGWEVYRITGRDCRTEYDEETGKLGAASEFIRQIAERHSIERHSLGRTEEQDAWVNVAESFTEKVLFEMRVRAEIRNMFARGSHESGARA
jgi:very-short-patch-repair endonuclease